MTVIMIPSRDVIEFVRAKHNPGLDLLAEIIKEGLRQGIMEETEDGYHMVPGAQPLEFFFGDPEEYEDD